MGRPCASPQLDPFFVQNLICLMHLKVMQWGPHACLETVPCFSKISWQFCGSAMGPVMTGEPAQVRKAWLSAKTRGSGSIHRHTMTSFITTSLMADTARTAHSA